MRQMLVWVVAAAAALIFHGIQGQQAYNEKDQLGYLCSNNTTLSECTTFLMYRAKANDTLQLLGNRFQLSRQQIASASNIQDGQQISADQLLLIPIPLCTCVGNRSQYNITYIIEKGDTFYLVSTGTFEGLTTYEAVEAANPSSQPALLQPGDGIVFPIRCSCPSTDQTSRGVQMLATYPIVAADTIDGIGRAWNVSTNDILSANELTQSTDLEENTTLLIPFTQTPTLASPHTSPPSSSPAPSPPLPAGPAVSHGASKIGLIVGVACSAAAVLVAILLLLIFRRRKWQKYPPSRPKFYMGTEYTTQTENPEVYGKPKRVSLQGDVLAGMSDLVDTDRPVWYSYEEIQEATQDLNAAYLIQGSVYRGELRDRAVAIKKMKGGMSQELKILCKVHHSNLIKLLGISVNDEDQMFLVYEYAENGSLSACLHNKSPFSSSNDSSSLSSSTLRWNTRLQIAVDVATALEYIHDYTKPSFVHKDLKSSNILLDENFHAKVANFGMAKLGVNLEDAPILTKHIAGTQGYMAPEYLAHGIVTPKLDVYAFGVILLEILSGQEAIIRSTDGGSLERGRFLSATIAPILDSDQKMQKLRDWMDPILQDSYPQGCALDVAVLARLCVEDDPLARPNMTDITYRLSKILQISLEWESSANMERDYISTPIEGR